LADESLTIVAAAGVPFDGGPSENTQPLKNLTVTANDGEISAAGQHYGDWRSQVSATERVSPIENNVTIAAGIDVQPRIFAWKPATRFLFFGNLSATAGTMKIDLASLDDVGGRPTARPQAHDDGQPHFCDRQAHRQTVTITGSSQDDDITLNLAGVTSANPVTMNAGRGRSSRTATSASTA